MKITHQSSWDAFETTIGDVIDTFRSTTPAVNQNFVQKSWIETSTCHSVSNTKFDWSTIFFQITPFYSPMLKTFTFYKMKRNKYLPHCHKCKFLIPHISLFEMVLFTNIKSESDELLTAQKLFKKEEEAWSERARRVSVWRPLRWTEQTRGTAKSISVGKSQGQSEKRRLPGTLCERQESSSVV